MLGCCQSAQWRHLLIVSWTVQKQILGFEYDYLMLLINAPNGGQKIGLQDVLWYPRTRTIMMSHTKINKAYEYVQVDEHKGIMLFSTDLMWQLALNVVSQVWDVERNKILRNMRGHAARVGALCWNNYILSRSVVVLCVHVRSYVCVCVFVRAFQTRNLWEPWIKCSSADMLAFVSTACAIDQAGIASEVSSLNRIIVWFVNVFRCILKQF